jgi:hypothetical protein
MNEPIFDAAWLKISMCENAGKSWRRLWGDAVDNSTRRTAGRRGRERRPPSWDSQADPRVI